MNNRNIYNAIKDFVDDLSSIFENSKTLALYQRLVTKIQSSDTERTKKHIELFSNYLQANSQHIISNNLANLPRIVFNEERGILIDIPLFVKKGDNETISGIRQHLLNIMNLIHPDENIQKTLKQSLNTVPQMPQLPFMGDMMKMFGDMNFDPNAPPDMTSMMGSAFTMLGKIQSGELNPKEMFSTMKNMINGLEKLVVQEIPMDSKDEITDPKDEKIETPKDESK